MNPELSAAASEVLRLNDEDYFTLTDERRMDLADAFSEISQSGAATDPRSIPPQLALGAPKRVDLASRDRIPVLLGSFETGLRMWQVNFNPNLNLFVKNLSTGELLHSKPLTSARRGLAPLPSGVGLPPQGVKAAVTNSSVVVVDLLDRMEGKLVAGEIVATAVAYDARSNSVRIQLEGRDKPATPATSVQPYVRSDLDLRPHIDPEIVVPGQGSARGGLRIRVAKQVAEADGVLRTELNQPFLPCHVVLMHLDKPALVIKAAPFVQQVVRTDGKPVFNVLFLVEMGGDKGYRVQPGDYQVYLDIGSEFLGPFPTKITE